MYITKKSLDILIVFQEIHHYGKIFRFCKCFSKNNSRGIAKINRSNKHTIKL